MAWNDEGPQAAPPEVPGSPFAFPTLRRDTRGNVNGYEYTPELGAAIAEEYGMAPQGGLSGLHAMAPERIPPPAIVRAWCKQYPAFGILMREAEKVRAECVMEQTVVLADTALGTPARVALQISARQRLAESLDSARFGRSPGNAPALPTGATPDQPTAIDLSDDQLLRLAAAGIKADA